MTNKKNKLITFFVSLLPGAGEMYLGFYKMGGSIMVLFWGGIMMFGNLFPPLFYLLPVLWFFSFFHTHNLNCMSDEEFYALEDDYLFHMSPEDIRGWTLKNRRLTAFILIFIGVSIIWNHLWSAIWSFSDWLGLSSVLLSILRHWIRAIPQLAAAFLIIWIGWKLIQDKKETLDELPKLDSKSSPREPSARDEPCSCDSSQEASA